MIKNVKDDALSCVRNIVPLSYRFVQLHPNGSGTAAFFLVLYLVCPFGFKFLIYSITIFYGVAIIIKVIANSEPYDAWEANNKHVLKNREFPPLQSDSGEGVSDGRKFKKPTISAQMSKRRNFKIRIEDLETLDDAERKQGEENLVDGVGKDLDPRGDDEKLEQKDGGMLTDEGIVAQQGATNLNGDESIPDFAPESEEPNQSREGSRSQSEVDDGSEEAEDVEDARENRSRAVEWTEDDQKNLTDLGLSEIERNKRLENLIAKRWAKKAMSMKGHEKFLDLGISHPGSIPPVNTSKNHFLPTHLSGDALESHLPSSAPSMLLPERNPFDLPYDLNEEKPNLTVDSFSAEILAPHPKDILSRHESFFYGPSFMTEIDEDSGTANSRQFSLLEKWNVREPRHSRFRQKSDKDRHDFLVEQRLSKVEHPEPRPDALENHSGNKETTNSIHGNLEVSPYEKVIEQHQDDASVTESVSSSSKDQKEPPQTLKDPGFSFQETSPHLVSVLSYEHGRQVTEHMNSRSSHTPTFSIASDMQVEISGSSTPRTLADYNISPDDAESSTHDGDMDRKTGFTNDEIWGALSKHDDIVTLELPEGPEDEEPSKQNNNMNNPFGSYISLMELDREDFHQRHAVSPESSGSDLEVRNARIDDPSNGNISESLNLEAKNYPVPPTFDRTHPKRDEEVNKEVR